MCIPNTGDYDIISMLDNLKNIEIDGRQLYYVEQGEKGLPVVIFIHGSLDYYLCWQTDDI